MRNERFVLAFLMINAACRKAAHEKGEEEEGHGEPKKVLCAGVESRQVTDTIDLRGTVAPLPDRDAQVSSQVAGRIAKVLVREGDRVVTGQPVAQIDTSPLEDDVAEAEGAVAKARAERQNAETTMNRVKRVFERGIAARQEYDDALARAASAKASESQADAAARRATRHVARGTVRSPMTGIVLKVMRRTGELSDGTPATPIVEVGDPSKIELVGDAPASDLVRITRGAGASVSIMGAGIKLGGTVTAVSPAVDKITGLGIVRVVLDIAKGGVTPPVGIYAIARIVTGEPRKATMVPAAALRNAAGPEAEVVVCADKKAHVVRVKTGVVLDQFVEVTGELKAGQEVAVAPVLGIADGDKLEPPEEEGAKTAQTAEVRRNEPEMDKEKK